jgi:hypothetical protein
MEYKNEDIFEYPWVWYFELVTTCYIDEDGKESSENNAKPIDLILSGL